MPDFSASAAMSSPSGRPISPRRRGCASAAGVRSRGRAGGMSVPRLLLFEWRVGGSDTWYWVAGASFLVGAVLALNLIDSPTGRALRAIHDSEIASSGLAIDVARKKLTVFVVSAVYASVAGSYLALFNGHITPEGSGFLRSIELVALVVLG